MKSILRLAGLCLSILLLATAAQAESTEAARKWFDKMEAVTEGAGAFSTDYTMKVHGSDYGLGQDGGFTGSMLVLDRTHSRMKMTGKFSSPLGEGQIDMLEVADGTYIWTEGEVPVLGKRVTKMPIDHVAPGGGSAMEDPLTQIRQMANRFDFDIVSQTDDAVTLEAKVTPGSDGIPPGIESVTLVFAKSTGYPMAMWMGDAAKPFVEIEFGNFEKIEDVGASEFRYTPPEGVEVKDLSEQGRGR